MEKRVLLAVFLSFLVLFVYQSLVVPPPPPRDEAVPVPDQLSDQGAPPAAVRDAVESTPDPAVVDAAEGEVVAEALVADTTPRDIYVETDEFQAIFSNEGAVLKSWRLKNYLDTRSEPLELVPQELGDLPRPFSLTVDRDGVTKTLRHALFKSSTDELLVGETPASLVFDYQDTSGLRARKEYRFDPSAEPFVLRFTAELEDASGPLNPTVQWGPAVRDEPASGGGFLYRQPPQAIFFRGDDGSRLDVSDIEDQPGYEGTFSFVGVDDHYFISAALPDDETVTVRYAAHTRGSSDTPQTLVAYDLTFAAPPTAIRFFIGPKDFDVLGGIEPDFVRAVHFGFFSWLVVPLHRSLKWVHSYVHNYGWAIIILTIMINTAIFPLRHKSVVSMRKMQAIQPEMKAIQDRYKNLKTTDPDKQKMNQELMNLYRERGVNPASGCLPMLLTMPVLFAFYSLLSVAIEIRGAPFVLWIQDLSQHDPMYVTPLLMGATMVAQQKMTPSTADATQQKVMMIMPVVFTFMFLWAPSGLVLYWFVSNLWGVGQQVITNRVIGPPPAHVVRPPAERRIKKRSDRKPAKSG